MPQLLSFVSRAGSACAPWHPLKAGRWPKMDEYFPHFVSTSNNALAFGPNHFSSCISPTWILWSQTIFSGNCHRECHPWVDYWGPARSFGEPQKLFYNFAITFATQPSQDASDPGSPRASLLLLITEAPCAPLPAAKLPLPDLLSLVSTRAASQCAHEYSRVTSSDERTWRTLHSRSRMLECCRCFWRFLLLKREDDEKRSSWALKNGVKMTAIRCGRKQVTSQFPSILASSVESSHVFRSPFNISTPRFSTHKSYVSQTNWQQDGMDFEDSKFWDTCTLLEKNPWILHQTTFPSFTPPPVASHSKLRTGGTPRSGTPPRSLEPKLRNLKVRWKHKGCTQFFFSI